MEDSQGIWATAELDLGTNFQAALMNGGVFAGLANPVASPPTPGNGGFGGIGGGGFGGGGFVGGGFGGG
jgi:hypothetical protein